MNDTDNNYSLYFEKAIRVTTSHQSGKILTFNIQTEMLGVIIRLLRTKRFTDSLNNHNTEKRKTNVHTEDEDDTTILTSYSLIVT